MNVKSFQAKSVEEVNQQLTNIKQEFQPTLAIVFVSVKYDLSQLIETFNQHEIQLLGCSSGGEIHEVEMIEKGIVVMVMDMKKEHFQLYGRETGTETTYQIAHDIGTHTKNCFENPALLVFSGGAKTDGEQIIFGIKDGAQKEIPIYGGLGGDDLEMNQTFAFSNELLTSDGLVGLIIDTDKVKVEGLATSGWKATGSTNQVTKSEGNIVYEINGQPALDIFRKYFGFSVIDGAGTELETISGQYPLQIERDEGHTILRSPLFADEDNGSLILAGGVKEGDMFRFSISPGFEVIEQTVEEFKNLKENVPDFDALILVSCKGRQTAFGPMIEEELLAIEKYWKAPLVGLFSYGEIGKVRNGTCEFHNVTSTLLGFKEV